MRDDGGASVEHGAQLSLGLGRDVPAGRRARRRVISASKRTDIPAFYMDWAVERFRQGWVDVVNPMFRHAADRERHTTRVSLLPEHVIAIVWWSKDYAPYLERRQHFAAYHQFFHFTINPRRADLAWLEPGVPPPAVALAQLRDLAALRGGPRMVAWRYDPIVLWTERGQVRSSWDPEFFDSMCRQLAEVGVDHCITSIADLYRKYRERMRRLYPERLPLDPPEEVLAPVAQEMADVARAHGMRLSACCEPRLAGRPGFARAACIDGTLLGASTAGATDRRMRGRGDCGCTVHTDIGDYEGQPCRHACVYCYANPHTDGVTQRRQGAKKEWNADSR